MKLESLPEFWEAFKCNRKFDSIAMKSHLQKGASSILYKQKPLPPKRKGSNHLKTDDIPS